MLMILFKALVFCIMPISGFFVIKNILKSDEKFFCKKTILCLILLTGLNLLIYSVKYSSFITVLNFICIVIFYKIIFDKNLFISFFLSVCIFIFMFLSEIIFSIVLLPFLSSGFFRTYGIGMFFGNVLIGLVSYLISCISFFRKMILSLLQKIDTYPKLQTIVLSVFWIVIASMSCYFIANSSTSSFEFVFGILIQVIFVVFLIFHFREQNEYTLLNEKFDVLYSYIETMEDYVDSEKLNIHEYKNQLSVIKGMTKNKNVNNYIDSIILDVNSSPSMDIDLSGLPKGGFKGIVYYKLLQARDKNVDVVLNISTKSNYFDFLSFNQIKQLSRLFGIYFDNALEAVMSEHENKITVEIYKNKYGINIVISNYYSGKLDYNKLNNKGYTTKGKGRGNGLYLAKKLIDNNDFFFVETKVISNYFVKKIIMNK